MLTPEQHIQLNSALIVALVAMVGCIGRVLVSMMGNIQARLDANTEIIQSNANKLHELGNGGTKAALAEALTDYGFMGIRGGRRKGDNQPTPTGWVAPAPPLHGVETVEDTPADTTPPAQ